MVDIDNHNLLIFLILINLDLMIQSYVSHLTFGNFFLGLKINSCHKIADMQWALASVVNVTSFWGSKIFAINFLASAFHKLSNAVCWILVHLNSTFFLHKMEKRFN